jgi:hypothetical protein
MVAEQFEVKSLGFIIKHNVVFIICHYKANLRQLRINFIFKV